MKYLALIFLFSGFFFSFVAGIGVVRFPDFYTRMHATGKGDTLGVALSVIGLIFYLAIDGGFTLTSIKLLFISLFILLANPIGTHAICRAAYRCGLKPWTRKGEKD